MTRETSDSSNEQARATSAGAEGAIPPTGGVPPEDARPATPGSATERSAAEDLVDGIDLMLRAARKTLRSVDPRVEEAAARAVARLQEFDTVAAENFREHAAKVDPKLAQLAQDAGQEIGSLVERLVGRLENALGKPGK